jgi:hypothetical protein
MVCMGDHEKPASNDKKWFVVLIMKNQRQMTKRLCVTGLKKPPSDE